MARTPRPQLDESISGKGTTEKVESLFIVKGKDGKVHSEPMTKEKAQAEMDRFVKHATADGKVLDLFLLEIVSEKKEETNEENNHDEKE